MKINFNEFKITDWKKKLKTKVWKSLLKCHISYDQWTYICMFSALNHMWGPKIIMNFWRPLDSSHSTFENVHTLNLIPFSFPTIVMEYSNENYNNNWSMLWNHFIKLEIIPGVSIRYSFTNVRLKWPASADSWPVIHSEPAIIIIDKCFGVLITELDGHSNAMQSR